MFHASSVVSAIGGIGGAGVVAGTSRYEQVAVGTSVPRNHSPVFPFSSFSSLFSLFPSSLCPPPHLQRTTSYNSRLTQSIHEAFGDEAPAASQAEIKSVHRKYFNDTAGIGIVEEHLCEDQGELRAVTRGRGLDMSDGSDGRWGGAEDDDAGVSVWGCC